MSCCSHDPTKQNMEKDEVATQEMVKEYYGKTLKTTKDCHAGVCQLDPAVPKHIRQALADVHEEVRNKYYGCGCVIPDVLEGCSVLDLGCGSGRDCYAISKLVGLSGHVVGIDMTEEQLAVARKHVDYHTEKFGYSKPNVEFVSGYIEKLQEAGLQDDTFDVVISNCVVNLTVDKKTVLQEVYRVLKEGGELYFSDVYTDTILSEMARNDPVLWGECISGALHWQQLHQLAEEIGFCHPLLVTANAVDTSMFTENLGAAQFVSVTYRLFKLPKSLHPVSIVTYNGGIPGCEDLLELDHQVLFEKGEEVVLGPELATLLATSRFSNFFSIKDAPRDVLPKFSQSEQPLDPFVYLAEPMPATADGKCASSSDGKCASSDGKCASSDGKCASSDGKCLAAKGKCTKGGSCCN